MTTVEDDRLAAADAGDAPWRRWGPYLSERAWGTVREDYSAEGDAWGAFPHDHARSRTYRWNEDGMAGLCDDQQGLCLALALWNGVDPILKERSFGLSGPEGNHGEDAKEHWWYLDATPTASWLRWRTHLPQREFPYADLVATNARRTKDEPEYELLDTGVFDDDRYWVVDVTYAKADPEDICMVIDIRNAGPDEATLHVLPTLWFRNTWSWSATAHRPALWGEDGVVVAASHNLGRRVLASSGTPEVLFCENESNAPRLWGAPATTRYPKDGINDHVLHGAATVNPHRTGTKASLHHVVTVPAGERVELRLRLSPTAAGDLEEGFDAVLADRSAEADAFHAARRPPGCGDDEAMVLRQALAGMVWGKQFYHLDVRRWLDGDPSQPAPPAARLTGRNATWRHLDNHDVISMPDPWEYPWYASWDLAFHAVAFAHIDPGFAKGQLLLLCREWYMHPNGQLPAYEWSFSDVNPPVHAWAALRVFEIDGGVDHDFLERIFHKLLINFTWWVNRKDTEGNNVFEGGFLGLDNIGLFDRSAPLAGGEHLEQSDGTAWMAMYCLDLLQMALVLAAHDPTYEDVATKFFEHYVGIATAMHEQGLWDDQDGFYYDVLHFDDGRRQPLRAVSMVGLIPLYAVTVLDHAVLDALPEFSARMRWFLEHRAPANDVVGHLHEAEAEDATLLSVVSPARLSRIVTRLLDEAQFLSPHGIRALSKQHAEHPLVVEVDGLEHRVDYEPGESTSGLFGGNSNWRGPVWFPVNFLVIEALRRFARALGPGYVVELPTGSERMADLTQVADNLSARLVSLFLRDASGRRPSFGASEVLQSHPDWRDLLVFNEYFHADTGAGLGATHQTGWTGLVADLIITRRR